MNQMKQQQSFNQSSDTLQATTKETEIFISHIENLSDELFYEIFDYLDGCDIYEAFSNLNIRFQCLLTYSSFLPKINYNSMLRSVFEHRSRQYIIPNRYQLFSLHLRHPTIIDAFIKLYTIDSSFNRLQSIVLYGIKSQKLTRFLSDLMPLPSLISLSITILYVFVDLNIIYRQIFRLPFLKYNQLSFISLDKSDHGSVLLPTVIHDQQFSSIEHLKIGHYCTVDELTSLLFYTPRLSHLTCRNLIESCRNNEREEVLIKLSNLTYISIENCDLSLDKFEIFIKRISLQLQVLRINTSTDVTYLDADRWERLILEHTPRLHKFYFIYRESVLHNFHRTSHHALINHFISPFWFERQWLFEMKFDADMVIYSIHPNRERWYALHEPAKNEIISSKDSCINQANFAIVPNRQQFVKSSIQLIIRTHLLDKIIESSNNDVSFIFALVPITVLDVDCSGMLVDTLIQLIQLIPKLNSLKVSSLSPPKSGCLSIEEEKTGHLPSNNNVITRVNLEKMNRIEEVHFLIDLCPWMEYLEIDCTNNINIELLVRSILTKDKKFISHLCSLCLRVLTADDDQTRMLEKVIHFERLLYNYGIKHIRNRIYLQWQPQ